MVAIPKPHEPAGIARTANTYANYLAMPREELIEFLIWNDINGVYRTEEAQANLRTGNVAGWNDIYAVRAVVRGMIEGEAEPIVPADKELRITSTLLHSRPNIYPQSPAAKKLAQDAGRKTLSIGMLERAVQQGYTVVHVGPFAEAWLRSVFNRYLTNGSFV